MPLSPLNPEIQMTYILFHKNGGWFTKMANLHSDYRKAAEYDEAEALDLVRLHDGKLIPCSKSLYEAAIRGLKL